MGGIGGHALRGVHGGRVAVAEVLADVVGVEHDAGAVGEAYGIYQVNCKGRNYNYYMAPAVYLIDAEGKISCFWILSGPRGRPSPECILGILSLAQKNDWKY